MLTENASLATGDIIDHVRLIMLFVTIISALVLCLCYLFFAMRRSQEREQQISKYSDLLLEGSEIERRRITRELHDIVMPLVKDTDVYNIIRSICMELASPDFSRVSLKDSLAEICMIFSRRTNIECICSMDENLDFSWLKPEYQLHLYRMIQESFNNIVKHSKAKRAFLTVRHSDQGVSKNILVCVSDDGIGIHGIQNISNIQNIQGMRSSPKKTGFKSGLGLMNMRQRAAIINAKLDFISETGNGFMVRIEINSN